jgi:hypothetical protein
MAAMKTHQFTRKTPDHLVVIPCRIGKDPVSLALDTGASHTTIDLTPMLISGYSLKDALRIEKLETASGIIDSYVFKVRQFTSMGLTRLDMEICAYDFFAYHYLTDFDGVLGLDFFDGKKFCIDLKQNIVSLY